MKKLMAVVIASMFATAAFAQQAGSVPPEQPAAGNPGKLTKQPATTAPVASSTASTDSSAAPTTRAERKAARKAKRAAKVGDKPIN